MTRKIINIVIFAVAILACVLTIVFAAMFDSAKLTQYKAVNVLHDNNQAILDELVAATPENLNAYVEKSQAIYNELDASIRSEKKAKESFYDYLTTLKALNADNFDAFKAGYPENVNVLLQQFDTEGIYVQQFNEKCTSYKAMSNYLISLEQSYNAVRQEYLQKEEYRNSLKIVQDGVSAIAELNSVEKKVHDLKEYQADITNFQFSSKKMLDSAIFVLYIMFAIAILSLLVFAVIRIATNLKNSYKGLLAILAMVVVFLIAYLIATPAMDDVFIKLQISPETARLIEAGCYFCYTVFTVAILTIIVAPLISAFRAKKSLK